MILFMGDDSVEELAHGPPPSAALVIPPASSSRPIPEHCQREFLQRRPPVAGGQALLTLLHQEPPFLSTLGHSDTPRAVESDPRSDGGFSRRPNSGEQAKRVSPSAKVTPDSDPPSQARPITSETGIDQTAEDVCGYCSSAPVGTRGVFTT